VGQVVRGIPVARWPKWCGDLFEMKIPATVQSKPGSSPDGGANVNVLLDLISRVSHLPGDVAECGVFRGSTLITMGLLLNQSWPAKRMIGFDSFAGFNDLIASDLVLGGADDAQKREGGFGQTSLSHVASRIEALGLGNTVELVPGYFADTLTSAPERSYCFVHLDCDIYGSYKQCLRYFYPRMPTGGIILLDEYNDPPWPGCNKAVDEFLADKPEQVQLIRKDGYEKYYISRS
jgi:hypothetical protein